MPPRRVLRLRRPQHPHPSPPARPRSRDGAAPAEPDRTGRGTAAPYRRGPCATREPEPCRDHPSWDTGDSGGTRPAQTRLAGGRHCGRTGGPVCGPAADRSPWAAARTVRAARRRCPDLDVMSNPDGPFDRRDGRVRTHRLDVAGRGGSRSRDHRQLAPVALWWERGRGSPAVFGSPEAGRRPVHPARGRAARTQLTST